MQNRPIIISFIYLFAVLLMWPGPAGAADVELVTRNTITFSETPLDTAVSNTGNYIYVLTKTGNILVYGANGDFNGKIEVDSAIDGIMAGPRDDILFLTSTEQKTVRITAVNFIKDINISHSPVKGPADASVTITVFSDFQCASCARAAEALDQAQADYPEDVKIVFKHYPLRGHRYAVKAAIAAMAAQKQDMFWLYHDILFDEGLNLTEKRLTEIAEALNLNMEKFERDYHAPEMVDRIRKDIAEAVALGVDGTPTLFVNGSLLRDWTPDGIEKAIQDAMGKKEREAGQASSAGISPEER